MTHLRPDSRARATARSGFTLIELLVTIGIIVILIGILLPVVAGVRKAGYAAATGQEIATIAGACQQYFQDYHSYPGPISEDVIDAQTAVTLGTAGPALTPAVIPTSSENLVLGLTGGLNLTFNTATSPATVTSFNYTPSIITQASGPQVLNTLINSQKQTSAYFSPKPDELAPTDPTNGYQKFGASDSYIPEYLDHIPGQVTNSTNGNFSFGPILYMRARVGATTMLHEGTGLGTGCQYNFQQLLPYGFTVASVSTSDFPVGSTGYPDSAWVYIANPALSQTPKGKDAFILISAGSDRIFGTKDDIIYGK